MNTKLIVGTSALLLLLSSTAMAYSDTRDAVLPGGIDNPIIGGVGLAFCERLSDDVSNPSPSPIFCEESGFSAIFADIGCSADFAPSALVLFGNDIPDGAAGCLDDLDGSAAAVTTDTGSDTDGKDSYATGSITITAGTGSFGDLNWLIGNDRDDDGSTTTDDTDGARDSTDESGGGACNFQPATAGCYDDEFLGGSGTVDALTTITSPTFCFTHDLDMAGGDWDSFAVFLGANVPSTTPYVGVAEVSLTANSSNTACTRSGHGDSNAEFDGAPAVGTAGTFFDCEVVLLPGETSGRCNNIICGFQGSNSVRLTASGDGVITTATGCATGNVGPSAVGGPPLTTVITPVPAGNYVCSVTAGPLGGVGICAAE